MNFKRALLASAFALSLPVSAMAAGNGNFYISGGLGANWLTDSDIEGTGINTEAEYDAGWAGLAAVGYRYNNGFRTELEATYRENDVDNIGNAVVSTGDTNAFALMGNVVYDFMKDSRFTPYIGAGLGAVWLSADNHSPVGLTTLDDNTTEFAVQGIAGMSYNVNQTVTLFADYRYLSTFDTSMTASNNVGVDTDYDNHTIFAGVRINFGKPAPAPAPVKAAPAPVRAAEVTAKAFMIFFDFNKADITPEARQILQTAVDASKTGSKPVRIDVTGHADRSGTDSYNQKLSERRSNAVRNELRRLGLKETEIATFAKGERDPLVQTDDGVKEPQNRRAEVVFH